MVYPFGIGLLNLSGARVPKTWEKNSTCIVTNGHQRHNNRGEEGFEEPTGDQQFDLSSKEAKPWFLEVISASSMRWSFNRTPWLKNLLFPGKISSKRWILHYVDLLVYRSVRDLCSAFLRDLRAFRWFLFKHQKCHYQDLVFPYFLGLINS